MTDISAVTSRTFVQMLSHELAVPAPQLLQFLREKLQREFSLRELGLEEDDREGTELHETEESGRRTDAESSQPVHLLERRHAALLIHVVLRDFLGEADEEDISAALRLKDLYECKHCFTHIAQVYAKGIMEADDAFRLYGHIGEDEAQLIAERTADRGLRHIPVPEPEGEVIDLGRCSAEQLKEKFEGQYFLLVDVREQDEHEDDCSRDEHFLEGSASVPLREIVKNPRGLEEYRERCSVGSDQAHEPDILHTPIVLYCAEGTRSRAAADCLLKSGYKKLYVIEGVDNSAVTG